MQLFTFCVKESFVCCKGQLCSGGDSEELLVIDEWPSLCGLPKVCEKWNGDFFQCLLLLMQDKLYKEKFSVLPGLNSPARLIREIVELARGVIYNPMKYQSPAS